MNNLIEKVLENKAKGIKRSPCKSNRASALGNAVPILEGCLRRGVYERTHWQEKELHDARVQLIFDEGRHHERIVLADLAAAGVDIIEQNSAFELPAQEITGHVDGTYIEDGIAYPVEIKSMSPNIFPQVNCFDDLKKKPWLRAYMAQITIYMLQKNIDKGIFILKNKSTGELKQIVVDLDYVLGEACLKTAEAINSHVQAKTLPDRITEMEKCRDCPFKLTCQPDINFGEPLKIVDDPRFEERLDKYFSLSDSATEYDLTYKIIKGRIEATIGDQKELKIICGKYNVTGKRDARNSLRIIIEKI